jgi:hypothetical protein
MWIAIGIIVVVVAFIAAAAVYQYVRPPRGPSIGRHELTPFEATATAKPNTTGALAGDGPGGDWTNRAGSSWDKQTSGETKDQS